MTVFIILSISSHICVFCYDSIRSTVQLSWKVLYLNFILCMMKNKLRQNKTKQKMSKFPCIQYSVKARYIRITGKNRKTYSLKYCSFCFSHVKAPTGPCSSAPCINGGVCRDYGVDESGQQTYTCECPVGFSGMNCENPSG